MDSSERDLTGRDLFPGYNSSLHITYLIFPNYEQLYLGSMGKFEDILNKHRKWATV